MIDSKGMLPLESIEDLQGVRVKPGELGQFRDVLNNRIFTGFVHKIGQTDMSTYVLLVRRKSNPHRERLVCVKSKLASIRPIPIKVT